MIFKLLKDLFFHRAGKEESEVPGEGVQGGQMRGKHTQGQEDGAGERPAGVLQSGGCG